MIGYLPPRNINLVNLFSMTSFVNITDIIKTTTLTINIQWYPLILKCIIMGFIIIERNNELKKYMPNEILPK